MRRNAQQQVTTNRDHPSIPKAGGTMTGELVVEESPTQDRQVVPKWYADGTSVTKNIIVMYAGLFVDIPTGWALCDGGGGTVDLSDSFIYGCTTDAQSGNVGGTTDAGVYSHNHTATHTHVSTAAADGEHDHIVTTYIAQDGESGGSDIGGTPGAGTGTSTFVSAADDNTTDTSEHSHVLTVDTTNVTTSSAGGLGTGANLPGYIKLAFIQKVL